MLSNLIRGGGGRRGEEEEGEDVLVKEEVKEEEKKKEETKYCKLDNLHRINYTNLWCIASHFCHSVLPLTEIEYFGRRLHASLRLIPLNAQMKPPLRAPKELKVCTTTSRTAPLFPHY